MVSKDFDLIVKKLPRELEYINLYFIGDLHIASQDFNEPLFFKWRDMVKNDPNGYVVILGDIFDNALKSSKSNSYEARMRPREEKAYFVEHFACIADRVLLVLDGNHEYRSVNATDDSPLYDMACKLDLEELYRENFGFLKVNLGEKNKDRQYSYAIAVGHGSTKRKAEIFSFVVDNVDVFVTGHTHQASFMNPARIVIDMHNEVVREEDFVRIVVPSFLKVGGYGLRGMYEPAGHKLPIVRLSGKEKEVSVLWK